MNHAVHLGDYAEVWPRVRQGPVALVFADLPYGVTANDWDEAPDLALFWRTFAQEAAAGATFVFTATQPYATDIINSARKMFRYELMWVKNGGTGFLNAKRAPLRQHENVLVFSKALGTYNPQMKQGKPYSVKFTEKRQGNNYAAFGDSGHPDETYVSDGKRYPTSLLLASAPRGLHPTQKPVTLLQWLIRTYTNPGELVVDPTAGSGTTAIAALRCGRTSICIEKNTRYFYGIQDRIHKERAGGVADKPAPRNEAFAP